MIVEVCVASVDSAVVAQQAGADRIELCTELGVGGITPSVGLFEQVKARVTLPVHVLIRPRSGDFSYTDAEFEVIQADIANFKTLGADGIVCGALTTDYQLDVPRTKRLLAGAAGVSFTFHRAFDWVQEPMSTFQILQEMGADCVLTSGKSKTAIEGLPLLMELNKRARTTTIMPGAGIGFANAIKFKEAGFNAMHLSGTTMYENLIQSPGISLMGTRLLSETHIPRADLKTLSAVVRSVK
ncbi:MAG: copper homeostasis protein CutC [Eudoraea sp.]|nr:copper homeostasis protein CutC [Eudoraea sp.]NNJ39643.1 copper homeostasis protein CutC [Eudoraea sp.]